MTNTPDNFGNENSKDNGSTQAYPGQPTPPPAAPGYQNPVPPQAPYGGYSQPQQSSGYGAPQQPQNYGYNSPQQPPYGQSNGAPWGQQQPPRQVPYSGYGQPQQQQLNGYGIKHNTLAIVALVVSVLMAAVFPLSGLILGIVALRRINGGNTPWANGDKAMAWIAIGISALGILASIILRLSTLSSGGY